MGLMEKAVLFYSAWKRPSKRSDIFLSLEQNYTVIPIKIQRKNIISRRKNKYKDAEAEANL